MVHCVTNAQKIASHYVTNANVHYVTNVLYYSYKVNKSHSNENTRCGSENGTFIKVSITK